MAGYPYVERGASGRLSQSQAGSPASKASSGKALPTYGPSNAANRAQARKQRLSTDQRCQPRQIQATQSGPLQTTPTSFRRSLSSAKLEEAAVAKARSEALPDKRTRSPGVESQRSLSPQLQRQAASTDSLRDTARRLASPEPRSPSREAAQAPVLAGRRIPWGPSRPSLQPRQGREARSGGVGRRFSEASQPSQRIEVSSRGRSQSMAAAPAPRGPQQRRSGLERFTEAQKDTFDRALSEIRAGRKSSCWMWFVIPTPPHVVHGVEKGSSVNRKFALRSDDEARAFLAFEDDGVSLRQNYLGIMTAVLDQLRAGKSAPSLMGNFDAPKLASSARLFERVTRDWDPELHGVLRAVLKALATPGS